jgi:hypothetical protein
MTRWDYMKLRLNDSSVRFRVTPSEVETLLHCGSLQRATRFGPGADEKLVYKIESDPEAAELGCNYSAGTITVTVPAIVLRAWANSDQVGIEANELITGGVRLNVLIEKDFACRDARAAEDQTDRFANPVGRTK